jgi:hypothetical protein
MSLSHCRYVAAALTISLAFTLATGCGRDEDDTSAGQSSEATAEGYEDTGDETAEAETTDAEAAQSPADKSASPAPAGPTKDVAIAPSATDSPMQSAFIFYTAKEAAPAVAAFHKKDLESKGWKISRNDTSKLPGAATAQGVIQQYEKGSDVLTVLLTEQVGEGTMTSVCVMDIPLPPTLSHINPYGGQGSGEIAEPPAQAIAWFTKELSARGWTASPVQDAGGTQAVNFRKGQRTLSTQFRPAGKGTSFYFMHMG